jgi:hypothetical protein
MYWPVYLHGKTYLLSSQLKPFVDIIPSLWLCKEKESFARLPGGSIIAMIFIFGLDGEIACKLGFVIK